MALVIDTAVKAFDLEAVHRGDCIRIRRAGDTTCKNGFVTKVNEKEIQILYCNTQNTATSYCTITAADVAIGVWEVWWTEDIQNVNYEYNGGGDNA